MPDYLIAVLIIAAVAVGIGFAIYSKRKRAEKRNLNKLHVKLPNMADFVYKYDEPGKPYISSVVPVPEEARQAIYDGIFEVCEATKAMFPHWTAVRTPYDFNVMLIEPDGINVENTPGAPHIDFLIKNDSMEVIQTIPTAGTVIGIGTDNIVPSNIVLPHQAVQNWQYLDYLKNSAHNEAEHYVELFNDKALFNQYSQVADQHPRYVYTAPFDESSIVARGFVSAKPALADCGCRFESGAQPQEGRGLAS